MQDTSKPVEPLDVRRLRGLLAEAQITHKDFAAACGLSRAFFSHVLAGRVRPGELARLKMARLKMAHGLHVLGLDREVIPHAS
jgi:transcriptional regulator with XRE-family HTH domain